MVNRIAQPHLTPQTSRGRRWGGGLGLLLWGISVGFAGAQPQPPPQPKHRPYELVLETLGDPQVNPLPLEQPQIRTLGAESDLDNQGHPCEVWALQVEQPQTVRLTVTSREADPMVKLLDTPQVFQAPPLAENDDLSGGSDALLDYQLLPGQTYYVLVSLYSTNATTASYTLTATPFTPAQPRPLPWDETVVGHLGVQSNSLQGRYCDIWTFSVPEPQVVLAALEPAEAARLNVFVGPCKEGQTAQKQGQPSLRQRIEAQPGREYQVAVLAWEKEADYQLHLGPYTPPPLPPTTPLPAEGTVDGKFTEQSPVFFDVPCQVWQIEGGLGRRLTLTCFSETTDPFLIVFDTPDFVMLPDDPKVAQAIASDDDSGGGTNARLSFDAETGQTYYLLVLGYGLGTYQLQVESGLLSPLKVLPLGLGVTSTLTDGPEIWELTPPTAGVVTVEMKSQQFDSFVAIKPGRSSSTILAEDDDSGVDLNAVVRFLAEAQRTYYVQAQRSDVADLAGAGLYTLEATLAEVPPAPLLTPGLPVNGTVSGAPALAGQSWTFTAPIPQRVCLRLDNLEFDPHVLVRAGGPAGPLVVDNTTAQVVFQAEAGTVYFIQIGMSEEGLEEPPEGPLEEEQDLAAPELE